MKSAGIVGRGGALVGLGGFLPVGPLHQVGGLGKNGHRFLAAAPVAGAATHMVKVQVGQDYQVDVVGLDALPGQVVHQHPGPHPVDGLGAAGVLGADAGVHQDGLAAGADEQAVEAQFDAVSAVGRTQATPDGLGNHAEERAAVHPEDAVADDG